MTDNTCPFEKSEPGMRYEYKIDELANQHKELRADLHELKSDVHALSGKISGLEKADATVAADLVVSNMSLRNHIVAEEKRWIVLMRIIWGLALGIIYIAFTNTASVIDAIKLLK